MYTSRNENVSTVIHFDHLPVTCDPNEILKWGILLIEYARCLWANNNQQYIKVSSCKWKVTKEIKERFRKVERSHLVLLIF